MPLNVLPTYDKHVFTAVMDTDLFQWHVSPEENGSGVADHRPLVIVGLMGRMYDLAAALKSVPSQYLRLARSRRALLVFDNSGEGTRFSTNLMAHWHETLREFDLFGLPIVHLTQDRTFETSFRMWKSSINQSIDLDIIVYHYFHRQFSSYVYNRRHVDWSGKKERFHDQLARSSTRKFVSLNYKARPHRMRFLISLLRDGLWDHGHVSFGGLERDRKIADLVKWKRPDPVAEFLRDPLGMGLEESIAGLEAKGGVMLGEEVVYRADGLVDSASIVHAGGDEIYRSSYFTTVMETEMDKMGARVTEKILKPLTNFHPFIVFGNYQSLHRVRELGFRTFSDVFDESYDEIADPLTRFEAAYGEFVRLCNRSKSDLNAMLETIAETLIFNAHRAHFDLDPFLRKNMDRSVADRLRGLAQAV